MQRITIKIAILCICSTSYAVVLTHDPAYDLLVPAEAYQGVGTWMVGDSIVATGHAIDVDNLGTSKNKRIEQEWALEDCKRRMMTCAAASKVPSFDEDSYDLEGDVSEFITVATFKLDDQEGLFLIGVVHKKQVSVKSTFNIKKARQFAIALFESGQYMEASTKFAALSLQGIQDEEIISIARAAGWHVNLEAGIIGDAKVQALEGLGRFYYERQAYEKSLRHFYDLYLDTQKPETELLKMLIDLCDKTHREETSTKFRAELARIQNIENPAQVRDIRIDEPFAPILQNESMLLENGGAKIVEHEGATYFFAVGSTDIRDDSGQEHLRQMKVARAQAQKEAVSFAEETEVVVEESRTEKTVINNQNGQKSVYTMKEYDESVRTKVKGLISSMTDVGSWKSSDGKVFFFAIGCRLN